MKLLSESLIETIGGSKVYERGRALYEAGQCGELDIQGERIHAQVDGNESYAVQLRHTNKIFEGSCSCPASDHFDFCKHCVAAALKYYYQTQGNQELAEVEPENRLEAYLSTLTKPELESALARLVRADADQHQLWQLRAELANGQLDAKELRKHITAAIPYKSSGIWRFQEVAKYFDTALAKLTAIEPAFERLPSSQVLKLLCYAYERLEKTLETIDDSGGYRYGLMELLDQRFKAFFRRNEVSAEERVKLAIDLLTHQKFSYELLNQPDGIVALLDQSEHALLVKQLSKLWEKIPAPTSKERHQATPLSRIQNVLVAHARASNNRDLEIELLGKTAIDVRSSLDLARRCIDLKLLDEANKWLSYASQIEKLSVHDVRLIEHTQIDLWLAQKQYEKALHAQWQWFEEDESLEALKDVLLTADKLEQRELYLQKGIQSLAEKSNTSGNTSRGLDRAETLISVYLHEGLYDDAVKLASHTKLRAGSLMAVANHAPEFTEQVVEIAERAVGFLCDFGSNETYERAVSFLNKLERRVAPNAQFENLIARVYEHPGNKSKRNFIQLLKSSFPNYF